MSNPIVIPTPAAPPAGFVYQPVPGTKAKKAKKPMGSWKRWKCPECRQEQESRGRAPLCCGVSSKFIGLA